MVNPARTRTVQNLIQVPGTGGTAFASKRVTIRLNTPGFIDGGSVEKVRTRYATTDATGLWSCVLEVNADIDPAGTSYTVHEAAGLSWTFIVPAGSGPVNLRDILVDAPTNPDPLVAGVPLPGSSVPAGYVWTTTGGGEGDYAPETGGGSGGVTSFQTRTGAVTLSKADVTGTGLAAADVGADAAGAAAAAQTAAVASADAYTDGKITAEVTRANAAYDAAGAAAAVTTTSIGAATAAALTSEAATARAAESANATAIATEATTARTAEGLLAPKASPSFTGTPTAPTRSAGDNSTKLATTAYADAAVAAAASTTLAPIEAIEGMPFTAYGHSYLTTGVTGTKIVDRLVARNHTAAVSNQAQAGTYLAQIATQIGSTWTANTLGFVVFQGCVNNATGSANSTGPTAGQLTLAQESFRACMAVLTAQAVLAYTSVSFAFSAGWTAGVTSTAGSYVDVAWTGDTAYLRLGFTSAGSNSVTITRDANGGTYATINTGAFGGGIDFTGAVKLAGFGAGTHTVRVTLVSGSALTVAGIAIPSTAAPLIAWLKEGHVLYNPPYENAAIDAILAACATIAADFSTVVPVSVGADWDTATMIGSDLLHPNDKGTAYWADRVMLALAGTAFRQGINNITATTQVSPAYTAPTPAFTGVPAQVTGLSATAGNTQVVLAWSAPANGGSAITDYTVEYSSNGGTSWSPFAHTASTTTGRTVTGLTNGTAYLFRVSAVNAIGTGPASATSSATPGAPTAPGAPTGLTPTAGNAQVALAWTAPASNGGSAITDYVVQYRTTVGPGSWVTFADGTSTAVSATVTGLTNGTSYDFQVAAVNAIGQGSYSSTATASPSAPAFDANSYGGGLLGAWYKADSLALSDGAAVTAWADSTTGGALPLTVPSGSVAPVYKATTGPNSKPMVHFVKASSHALSSAASLVAATQLTAFIVVEIATTSQTFLSKLGTGTSDFVTNIGGNGLAEWYNNPRTTVGTLGINTWAILEFVSDSAAGSSGFLNGTAGGTGAYNAQAINGAVQIGVVAAGYGDFDCAEYIVYKTALNSTDRSTIRHALGTKYGITVV